ncbi:MAG: adenylate kinase [Cyanobacteria bacterium J083]|nr:MAG: adenylate kinase [Cyanobacteria bacterium J083]
MKKVAVFGNTGGGKSTLSKKLAEITGLPLYILDKVQYEAGGKKVAYQDYRQAHERILASEQWIIEGFGCLETLWTRLDAADTLVYIDLPLPRHFIWVSKRLIKGLWQNPAGWPENSPIIKGTLNSYSVLMACHSKLTPKYRDYVKQHERTKEVYHLKSVKSMAQFLAGLESQAI